MSLAIKTYPPFQIILFSSADDNWRIGGIIPVRVSKITNWFIKELDKGNDDNIIALDWKGNHVSLDNGTEIPLVEFEETIIDSFGKSETISHYLPYHDFMSLPLAVNWEDMEEQADIDFYVQNPEDDLDNPL